jgi:transcriptional regulator with XRE-family HTH domain
MEILSVGEKIKRARIYKDCTLKELCGDRISISKMSCIENDKVKPESWIIELIAQKLDMDESYLNQGIREQIQNNIAYLDDDNKDKEEDIKYNLEYAMQYECFDLAFELMHRLFNYYLENEQIEKNQLIIATYYDICEKSGGACNQIVYIKDIARYFFVNKEYGQAITYYSNLSDILQKQAKVNVELLTYIKFNEVACLLALKKYDKAYEISTEFEMYIERVNSNREKADMYSMLAFMSLIKKTDKFKAYECLAYKFYGDENCKKAKAMYYYASPMFDLGMNEEAISYIKNGLELYSKEDKGRYVSYMLLCISQLVSRNILDIAQEVCDEALNTAINLDNIKLIEKAYYYKSVILQKKGDISSAEMYMNLSTDALFKFGNKKQKFERYIEMGNMYHLLGQLNDSIRCFSMALSFEKKM